MNIKQNYAYGIYEVGTKKFLNKTDALIEASRTGQTLDWNFHDDVYSKYNWTQRPVGDLRDLYRQRAQQIRDQYDYVVVHFSGGADSWTVLHSFLSNGIHVDEVYSRWAFAEKKYKDYDHTNLEEINLFSEYEFAALPVLKDVEKRFPQTKIYIDDYSEDYEKDVSEHALNNANSYLNLGVFYRFSRKSPWEIEAAEKGQRVAVVYGFDKIGYCLKDNMMYAFFNDRVAGADRDLSRTVEPFYWTPQLPQIPIAQAHEIKMFYEANTELADEIADEHELTKFNKKTYTQVCYPDYNADTFQVHKALGTEIWKSALWIHKHNPRHVESWQWSLEQFTNNIDSKFFSMHNNKIRLGYKTNISQLYFLGKFARFDK